MRILVVSKCSPLAERTSASMHWRAADPNLCYAVKGFKKGEKETLAYHWPFVPLMHVFFRDLCTKQMPRDNSCTVIFPRLEHHPVPLRPILQPKAS